MPVNKQLYEAMQERRSAEHHAAERGDAVRSRLERVSAAYRDFFFYYDEAPLLVVDTSDIDFVARPADFDVLLKEIRTVKKGVQHYVPLGSRGSR